jgi:hypothetical protein
VSRRFIVVKLRKRKVHEFLRRRRRRGVEQITGNGRQPELDNDSYVRRAMGGRSGRRPTPEVAGLTGGASGCIHKFQFCMQNRVILPLYSPIKAILRSCVCNVRMAQGESSSRGSAPESLLWRRATDPLTRAQGCSIAPESSRSTTTRRPKRCSLYITITRRPAHRRRASH